MKKALLLILITGCFVLYSADSLKVVWGMVHDTGEEFTADELANVTFKAWIENSGEVFISSFTTDIDPGNSIECFEDLRGVCVIDFINFEGWEWRNGDEFHLTITDSAFYKGTFFTAEAVWNIPENSETINYLGFEDYFGYGGYPINTWYPYSDIDIVYIGTADHNSEIFDFSVFPFDNVSFTCWVSGRESEVIDQNSTGSDYIDYSPDASAIKIARYAFPTSWASGDTLNVRIKQRFPGQGYYTGEKQFVFTNTLSFSHYGPFDIKFGLDALYEEVGAGGGDPVIADNWVVDTGVEESEAVPLATALYQNYPNPFNPVTQINFELSKTADIKLSIYNINGQLVSELINGVIYAGFHTVDFDGSRLNSGVYYYSLDVDGIKLTQKMIFMK